MTKLDQYLVHRFNLPVSCLSQFLAENWVKTCLSNQLQNREKQVKTCVKMWKTGEFEAISILFQGFRFESSYCSSKDLETIVKAFLFVAFNLTNGAFPALWAWYHLTAQRAHRSPGRSPGNHGLGVERSFPCDFV